MEHTKSKTPPKRVSDRPRREAPARKPPAPAEDAPAPEWDAKTRRLDPDEADLGLATDRPASEESAKPPRAPHPFEIEPPAAKTVATPAARDTDVLSFQNDPRILEERPLPPPMRATLWSVLAFITLGIIWMCIGRVDVVIAAPGEIVLDRPRVAVQPLTSGVITQVMVKVGDRVEAGQILAELDPTMTGADVTRTRQKIESLRAERRRLEAERGGRGFTADPANPYEALQGAQFAARAAERRARLEELQSREARLNSQITAKRNLITRRTSELQIAQQLSEMRRQAYERNRAGTLRQSLEAQRDVLRVEAEINDNEDQILALRAEVTEVKAQRAAYENELARSRIERLVAIERELEEAEEILKTAEMVHDRIHLRAPEAAVVHQIEERYVGSVMREAETLFLLTPAGGERLVELRVRPQDIGDLFVGQQVHVKLEAYPFQKYGLLEGEVRSISQDVVQPETREEQIAYRVLVGLTKTELDNAPERFSLIPGMRVTGEAAVKDRLLIEFILYPLIRYWDESMRQK